MYQEGVVVLMKDKKQTNKEVFEETFKDILSNDVPIFETDKDRLVLGDPHFENVPKFSEDDLSEVMKDYIPESVHDEAWEGFVERQPLPPLEKEQEANLISVGLQELRKMKEYMYYVHSHMQNEFQSLYATYPILLEKYLNEVFGATHQKISNTIEDLNHLIVGEIDKMTAVKEDFRLYQEFEEKRLSVLYKILDHYNNRNDI